MVLPIVLGTRIYDPVNVVVALTLYGLALLVPACVDALDSVDADAVDAAAAMGMGRVRRFLAVELPLAGPAILAGLRVITMNEAEFSGPLTYNLKALGANTIPCLWSHPHIFNISLRDNLVFDKAILDSDIMEILNALKLSHFVNSLPEGLDTVMDMNNLTVSDGERSRIALARILQY